MGDKESKKAGFGERPILITSTSARRLVFSALEFAMINNTLELKTPEWHKTHNTALRC